MKQNYVIKAINLKLENRPYFFTKTTNIRQRIERIKLTLSQEVIEQDYLKEFKGQQNDLTFEVYTLTNIIHPD